MPFVSVRDHTSQVNELVEFYGTDAEARYRANLLNQDVIAHNGLLQRYRGVLISASAPGTPDHRAFVPHSFTWSFSFKVDGGPLETYNQNGPWPYDLVLRRWRQAFGEGRVTDSTTTIPVQSPPNFYLA